MQSLSAKRVAYCYLHVMSSVFCRQHYSAERMSLVVLGGQPLDELQDWVTDLFSSVPSGKGPRPTFFDAGMPYKVCILPSCMAAPQALLTC